jgi:hypothetical protein
MSLFKESSVPFVIKSPKISPQRAQKAQRNVYQKTKKWIGFFPKKSSPRCKPGFRIYFASERTGFRLSPE